jgi:hypothetical protein
MQQSWWNTRRHCLLRTIIAGIAAIDLPDRLFVEFLSRLRSKNISLSSELKSLLSPNLSRLDEEGRTRRHGRWVRDAMAAAVRETKRDAGGRRSRVVLMPRRWHSSRAEVSAR